MEQATVSKRKDRPPLATVKIDGDYCGTCDRCVVACPFEAVRLDKATKKVVLDIEKCQVCGICSAACPASAIDTEYFDEDSLVAYVNNSIKATGFQDLVLACRASSPPETETSELLQEQGLKEHLLVRLPCVGRLSAQFYLAILTAGVKRITTVRCEEKFCRFKNGSRVNALLLQLTGLLLEQLGFDGATLPSTTSSPKAIFDSSKCVGCGKCKFVCPFDAIHLKPMGTPEIVPDSCTGCGACAMVFPHQAMQLKGFEYDKTLRLVQKYAAEAFNKPHKLRPVVLVFVCQWCDFNELNNPADDNQRTLWFIEIPCAKALDPVHVISALYSGFDGVFVATCSEVDCKLEKGKEVAARNVDTLKKVLRHLHLLDKFEICSASPRYVGDLSLKLKRFLDGLIPRESS